MRGFLAPAKRQSPNEVQKAFGALARGRRSKMAKAAQTTLLKADQWARGDQTPKPIADALAKGLAALQSKKKK